MSVFERWFHHRGSRRQPGAYSHGNLHFVELRRVVKTFHTPAGAFTALHDVDLQVDGGEFVTVVGKSGSGKSTLINMLTGIDRPTAGEVLVGDTAVHELSEGQLAVWRGRTVGVVFQFFQLLPTLSLVENVMLPMDFCHKYDAGERRERAMALLEQVSMADHALKLPSGISGGQQQRVAIARALANDPPVVVADEPTGNLDSRTAGQVMALFEGLVERGKTILMVTHDHDLAQRGTRTVVVADGEIVDQITRTPHPLAPSPSRGEGGRRRSSVDQREPGVDLTPRPPLRPEEGEQIHDEGASFPSPLEGEGPGVRGRAMEPVHA